MVLNIYFRLKRCHNTLPVLISYINYSFIQSQFTLLVVAWKLKNTIYIPSVCQQHISTTFINWIVGCVLSELFSSSTTKERGGSGASCFQSYYYYYYYYKLSFSVIVENWKMLKISLQVLLFLTDLTKMCYSTQISMFWNIWQKSPSMCSDATSHSSSINTGQCTVGAASINIFHNCVLQ